MAREIPLKHGGFTIVDDEQYDRFAKYEWWVSKLGYVCRGGCGADGKWTYVFMHRCLLWAPPGMETDHRNGNKLDNRRENLRPCTHAQNMQNRGKTNRPATSKFKGVKWDKNTQKWQAKIKADGRAHDLGRFDDEVEAALAYNEAAKQYHGEFAYLNDVI